MRFLVISVLIFLLACKFDEIIKTGDNSAWYFYEVDDVGAIEVSNASFPIIAFPSNFYSISGQNNEILAVPINNFYEFIDYSVQHVTSLEGNSRFIVGAINNTNIVPLYGLRLIAEDSESSAIFHENVEHATFIPNDQQSFHGVLESPLYLNDLNEVSLSGQIVQYTIQSNNIDTLSTYNFELTGIDLSKSIKGFVSKGTDNLYYAFQDQLFSWDMTTESLTSIPTGTEVKNLLFFDDKVMLIGSSNELKMYDEDLSLDRTIWLSEVIPATKDQKSTILKVFTSKIGIHMVLGVSSAIKRSDGVLVEVMSSLDLLTLSSEGIVEGRTIILEGTEGQNEKLFWNEFELLSQDIKNDEAYFMFKKALNESKYEYFVKKTSIN
jgi:hypothetical protein